MKNNNNIYNENQFSTTLQYTKNFKIKDLLKSEYNINIKSKTLILIYKKDKKHKGFSEKLIKEIQQQLNLYKEYNAFKEIIMEDQDFFNIYLHSKDNNTIKYYTFNIDEITYIPHQSLDPTNLNAIKLFQELNYSYLSETLLFTAYCINFIRKIDLNFLQDPQLVGTEILLLFPILVNEPFLKEITKIVADFYKR